MDLLWRSEPCTSAQSRALLHGLSRGASDFHWSSRVFHIVVIVVFVVCFFSFFFCRILTIISQLSGRSIKRSIVLLLFFPFFPPLSTPPRLCALCVCVSATLRGNVYCNVSVWCQLSRAASCLEERMTVWLCGDNVRALHLGVSFRLRLWRTLTLNVWCWRAQPTHK